ncbi:MAG: hypothetical protein JW781_11640 [Deltaproteobacteria bacterium]|nr:hypothetical protein [Candidatus Anaeroferrophillacea bacterium]
MTTSTSRGKRKTAAERRKRALAEVPESSGVTRDRKDKMAAFFAAESSREGSFSAAPEVGERPAGDDDQGGKQPVTEAAIREEAAAVTVTQAEEKTMEKPAETATPVEGEAAMTTPAEETPVGDAPIAEALAGESADGVAAEPESTPESAVESTSEPVIADRPESVDTAEMEHTTENHLVKGEKQMADAQEQRVVQQQAEAGTGGMVSFVALFVAIAALALVWFYASTSTGSPSVLSDLQKSKGALTARIDAIDAKVDALNAKLVEAEKAKLQKSVAASVEALETMAANAEGEVAEALKKMQADLQKMIDGVK